MIFIFFLNAKESLAVQVKLMPFGVGGSHFVSHFTSVGLV